MSISRKFVSSQVARMAGTEYFGALSDEAVLELQRALASSPSEPIAVGVINEWLETSASRPTPADLYRLIDKHAHPKTEYFNPEWPEPEPIGPEERAEIDAFAARLAALVESKKLKGRAIRERVG